MFEGLISDKISPEIPTSSPDLSPFPINRNAGSSDLGGVAPINSDNGDPLAGSRMASELSGGTREAAMTPIPFDWDKQKMDWFQNIPHYKTYGADPQAGPEFNEMKLGNVQTWWDKTGRGLSGIVPGFASGITDMISNWGNLASAISHGNLLDVFKQDQLEEINKQQQQFDNNYRIPQGSDPSTYTSLLNGMSGTSKFIGQLAEMAGETLAIQGIVALSGGLAAPLEGEEVLEAAKITAQATKLVDALQKPTAATRLWNGIGQAANNASKYLPGVGNTVGFAGDVIKGSETGSLATVVKGGAAFLNDLRSINAATAFASSNATATYQQQVNNQVAQFKKANGRDPDFTETDGMKQESAKVAKVDGAVNAFGMLMLEKMAFGNFLNTRKSLQDVVESQGRDIYDKVGIKPSDIKGAVEEPLYMKSDMSWNTFKNSMFRWSSVEGNYGALGKDVLKKGVEFGVVGNTMSAIDESINAYFDAKHNNKNISWLDAVREGIGDQFTAKGAGNFISGFLQGSLLLGLGGAALGAGKKKVADYVGSKVSDTDKAERVYNEDQSNQRAEEFVKNVNDLWKDPLNPVKSTIHDMLLNGELSEGAKNSLAGNDRKAFHDKQDDASRIFMMKMIKNGLADMWVDRAKEQARTLNQDDLCKLMEVPSSPENFESIKQQIAELPERVHELRLVSDKVDKAMGNPFNPFTKGKDGERLYPDGSDEFKAQSANNRIYQAAKDYLVTVMDTANRALKRQSEILNGKPGATGVLDMPFTENLDFSTLYSTTSPELLDKQSAMYDQILSINPQDKDAIMGREVTARYKAKLVDYLKEYADALNDNRGEQDIYKIDSKHKEELARSMHEYLETLLTYRNLKGKVVDRRNPPTMDDVRNAMDKMLDYYKLGVDYGGASRMMNLIMDPSILTKFQLAFMSEGTKRQQEAETEDVNQPKPTDTTKPKPDYEDADIVTDEEPTSVPKPPVPEPTIPIQGKTADLKSIRNDLEKYVKGEGELSPQAKEYIHGNEKFTMQKLLGHKTIYQGDQSDEEEYDVKGSVIRDLRKDFDATIPKSKLDNLPHQPMVHSIGDKWGIVNSDEEPLNDKRYPTKLDANEALEQLYPKFKIADKEFQVGQHIYKDGDKFTIKSPTLIATVKGKQQIVTDEWYKNTTVEPVKPKEEIPANRLEGIWDAGTVRPAGFNPEQSAASQIKLDDQIRNTPKESLNDVFTIQVTPGKFAGGESYKNKQIEGNTHVDLKPADYTITIAGPDGTPVAFVDHDKYLFDGNPIPTKENIHLVVDTKGQPAEQIVNQYVANYNNFQLLKSAIETGNLQWIKLRSTPGSRDFIDRKNSDQWPTIGDHQKVGNELVAIYSQNKADIIYGTKPGDVEFPKEPNEYGDKIGLLKLPNSNHYWTQLVAPEFRNVSDDELNNLINELEVGSKQIRSLKADPEEQDKLAKQLTKRLGNELHITQNPKSGTVVTLNFTVGRDGYINAGVKVKEKVITNDVNGKPIEGWKEHNIGVAKINAGYHKTGSKFEVLDKDLDFGNEKGKNFIDRIVREINHLLGKQEKVAVPEFKIEPQNIRKNINDDTLTEDLIPQLKTTVSTKVVKNQQLEYYIDKSVGIQKSVPNVPETIVETTSDIPDNLDDVLNQLNSASKLVPIVGQPITSIGEIEQYATDKLPEFIDVNPDFQSKLVNGSVQIGQFVTNISELGKVTGTIHTSPEATHKYHEVFHGVFRLLLPQHEIVDLINEANDVNPLTPKKLEDFKQQYRFTDDQEARERYQEEFIADKFEEWKQDHKTWVPDGIRGFFQRLWNYIKELFNRLTGNDIEALFYKIDRGAFKNTKLQENEFTTSPNNTAKLIQIGTDEGQPRFLDQETGNRLTSTIAALYHMADITEKGNKEQLINGIIKDYATMLNPEQDRYKSIYSDLYKANKETALAWAQKLNDVYRGVSRPEAITDLKSAIDEHLRVLGYKKELLDEELDRQEQKLGAMEAFDRLADEIGGYDALSPTIKQYINLVTYSYTDEFGNSELKQGVPLVQTVNGQKVYNGLTQLLKDTPDMDKFTDKLLNSVGEGELGTVIRQLLSDTQFNKGINGWEVGQNKVLFKQFINSFRVGSKGSITVELDRTGGTSRAYESNRLSSAKRQTDVWADSFDQVYYRRLLESTAKKTYAKEHIDAITELRDLIKSKDYEFTDDNRLVNKAQSLSNQLKDQLGISIEPKYIEYSISGNKDDRSNYMVNLLSTYTADPIKHDDLTKVRQLILDGKNPFTDAEGRMSDIAKGNVVFNSDVDSTTFQDAEGKNRYGFQKFNLFMERVIEFNDPDQVERLKQDPDFDNHLLHDDKFLNWDKKTATIDGITMRSHNLESGEPVADGEGIVFRHWGPREFNTFPFISYGNSTAENGVYGSWVYPRVLSDKQTGWLMSVPVIPAVYMDKGKVRLTPKVLDRLYSIVQGEINRIKTVIQQVDNGVAERDTIKNYNEGDLRGLKFFEATQMLGDKAEQLEQVLNEGTELTHDLKEFGIKKQIEQYFINAVQGYIDDALVENGLIEKQGNDYINKLMPKYLWDGIEGTKGDALNLNKNFIHNVAQVYISNYLNSQGITQLMLGNEAKLYDKKNIIKRASFLNSYGDSAWTPYSAPELGIDHPFDKFHVAVIQEPHFDGIDEADSQMYCTEKGMRYSLFGYGKLTKTQADVLTKLQSGKSVTSDEVFGTGGLNKKGGTFTPLKPVYFDGQTSIKSSQMMLTKEMVMVKGSDGKWIPNPQMEHLYHIWKAMTDYETANDTVAFVTPESAFKTLNKNIAPLDHNGIAQITADHFHELNPRYLREQSSKESKLIITDPTQAKRQIMSEQEPDTPVTFMGNETTVGAVRDAYQAATSQRLTNNWNSTINGLFSLDEGLSELNKSYSEGRVTPQLGKFYDRVRETLQSTGANEQTLEFFQTRDGEPLYAPDFPATLQKFTEVLLNYFGKPMSEKVPGIPAVRMSDYGVRKFKVVDTVDENGKPLTWTVVPDTDYRNNPDKYSDAIRFDQNREFTNLKPGDVILDRLRVNVPEYINGKPTGLFYNECIMPVQHAEEVGKVPDILSRVYHNRIPYADFNNGSFAKVIDYLSPALGQLIILPAKQMSASGADNDFDTDYVTIPDTYRKGGQLIKYGTVVTDSDKFYEYKRDQLANNREVKQLYYGDKFYSVEEVTATLLGDKEVNDFRMGEVLRELKLPSTVDEFIAKGGDKLTNSVLNNRILEGKIVLSGNKYIAEGQDAINMQQTSTDLLGNLVKPGGYFSDLLETALKNGEISNEEKQSIQKLLDTFNPPEVNANELYGQSIAHKSNSEGKNSVGAAANGVPTLSLLMQHNVQIDRLFAITYNGTRYDDFGSKNSSDGIRKFTAQMSYINSMTDNAKLQLASKLGLTIDALSTALAMSMTGIGTSDVQLYILQPAVRDYFKQLSTIKGKVKTKEEDRNSKSSILRNVLKRFEGTPTKELTREDLEHNLVKPDDSIQYSTLLDIEKAQVIAGRLFDLNRVMGLAGGLPADMEAVDNIQQSIDNLYKEGGPFDAMEAIHKDSIMDTYLEMFRQMNNLLPHLLLERSGTFMNMQDKALQNFDQFQVTKKGFKKQLKEDLISYLTFERYKYWLEHKGLPNTLDNSLIYNSIKGTKQDITDIVDKLRLTTTGKKNYFLTNCITTVQAADPSNTYKINMIKFNNWSRLSNDRQVQIRDSFVQLISAKDTKGDAMNLFNYLLVKDGGQFRSGSFIKFVAPFVFKDLLDRTGEVKKGLTNGYDSSLFAMEQDQLVHKFVDAYSTHNDNRGFLKTIKIGEHSEFTPEQLSGKKVNRELLEQVKNRQLPLYKEGTNYVIDQFRGIRADNQYGKKFNETEKLMLNKNIETIKKSGIGSDDNKLVFPMTIRDLEGKIYKLQSVEGKVPDTGLSTGTSAIYIPTKTTGARGTYKAGGASFGKLPYSDNLIGTQQLKSPDTTAFSTNQPKPKPIQTPVQKPVSDNTIAQLASKHGVKTIVQNGRAVMLDTNNQPIGETDPGKHLEYLNNQEQPEPQFDDEEGLDADTLAELYNKSAMKNQQPVVPSKPMQQDLFGQQENKLPTPEQIAKLPVFPNKYIDGGQSIDGIQMQSKLSGDSAYKAIQRGDRTESTRSANQFSKPHVGDYEVITSPSGERGLIQVISEVYKPNKQAFDQYEGWALGQWERSSPRFTDKWFSYRFKYLGELDKNNNLISILKEDKSIDWKQEIENLWEQKKGSEWESKEEFIKQARELYKHLSTKFDDNKVLEKLKACL